MTNDPYEQSGNRGPHAAGERSDAMATLLEESLEYSTPHRGEIVEGTVMGWDRDGALVDIGAKSEGLILRHEMQSLGSGAEQRLQSGEKVLVYVMQPETADGQVLLSLDRARGEQGWQTLQDLHDSGESFEGEVTGHNKGGLLVNVEGVNAFVPLSQLVGVRPDRGREGGHTLAEAVGRKLRLKVIEINRRRNRVILSERAALQEWRLQQKERLIQELHEGDIRRGRISSVRSFGVFVDLGGADGLAHLSELSWERDKSPGELFNVGDEVDVYVTKVDAENKKIALSLRRANPGQWDAVVDKYQEGQVVPGLVTKLVTFGAFARIEGPVEGLIHVSELVDRRIGHPKEVVREGDLLPLKVVRIERDRHRLGLSLRRARDEGETMGFVFTDGGEVLSVPDDIRAEFEAREGPLPAPAAYEEAPAEERPAPAAEEPVEQPAAAQDASAEPPADTTVTESAPSVTETPAEESKAAEPPPVQEPPAPPADEPPAEPEATAPAQDSAEESVTAEPPPVQEPPAPPADEPPAEPEATAPAQDVEAEEPKPAVAKAEAETAPPADETQPAPSEREPAAPEENGAVPADEGTPAGDEAPVSDEQRP